MLTLFSFDGQVLILGLTKVNLDRLQTVNPITYRGPKVMPVKDIIVVYGEDKIAILQQLKNAGVEIPQALQDDVAKEPT